MRRPWELGVDPDCRQSLRVSRPKHLHERSSSGGDEQEEGLGDRLPGRERDECSSVISKVGFWHEDPLAPPFSQAEPCSRKEVRDFHGDLLSVAVPLARRPRHPGDRYVWAGKGDSVDDIGGFTRLPCYL
eukprot:7892861-Pyramimonas_sp.AAC.1